MQAPKAQSREEVTPEELREFYRLNEAQDWLRLLPALRVCAAAVPPVYVAFVRATCYSRLGLQAIGNLFLRAAIELGGKESMLSRVAFDTLVFFSPSDAFEQSNRIIAAPQKYAPISVAQAITFVIGFLGGARLCLLATTWLTNCATRASGWMKCQRRRKTACDS